jgi:hypothetical protein
MEHFFYDFNPLQRTALDPIKQIMLSAKPATDRWIGTHVIFFFTKNA